MNFDFPALAARGRRFASVVAGAVLSLLAVSQAHALPSFSAQTGASCAACHVGGFGPELTSFGRAFKIGGYTMGKTKNPVSAMAIASWIHTGADQPGGAAPHYSANNNLTLDEASLFLAGGVNRNLGGFAQLTYDAIGRKLLWDGVDLRAVTTRKIGGRNAVLGLSLNNAPGIEDPWNTLSAWSFPYTASDLGPSPTTSVLSAGALEHNTLGLTGYMWLNNRWYASAGLYGGLSDAALKTVGLTAGDSANLKGAAPYLRFAYQNKNLEVGGFGLFAQTYPGGDKSAGTTDRLSDLGLDASYQKAIGHQDSLTLTGRYTHETQSLKASKILGDSANKSLSLNDVRTNLSYYWDGHVGASVGLFDTWGKADTLVYAANSSLKPDSNGATLQLDFTPWPTGKTPMGRHGATRFGVQYTAYNKFDGASTNYDGSGRNAKDNNTLRVFAWTTF